MKKTLFKTALLLGLAVLLSSCMSFFGSNPRVAKTFKMTADIGIPAAQSATVTFIDNLNNGHFKLKKWNGQDISFRLYGFNFEERWRSPYNKRNDKAILVVPAWDNSFIFDLIYRIGNTHSDGNNIEIRYSFEAGRQYHVKGRIEIMSTLLNPTPADNVIFNYDLFVGIYDVTGGSETLLREWDLRRKEVSY